MANYTNHCPEICFAYHFDYPRINVRLLWHQLFLQFQWRTTLLNLNFSQWSSCGLSFVSFLFKCEISIPLVQVLCLIIGLFFEGVDCRTKFFQNSKILQTLSNSINNLFCNYQLRFFWLLFHFANGKGQKLYHMALENAKRKLVCLANSQTRWKTDQFNLHLS